MSGPWETYQQQPAAPAEPGPWSKYAATPVDSTATQGEKPGFLRGAANAAAAQLGELALGAKQRFDEAANWVESKVPGAQEINAALGTPSAADILPQTQQAVVEQRKRNEAIYAAPGGTTGRVAGAIVPAVVSSLVPGGQGLSGTILSGALLGGAQPTVGDESVLKNMAIGGTGGAAGYGVGKVIGTVANKVTSAAATKMAERKAADASVAAAKGAGYTLPPATANPTKLNTALESFAGKTSVAQSASVKNQKATDALVRKALGLAEDTPLTPEMFEAIRAQAGQAYNAVAGVGKLPAAASDLPKSVNVQAFTDKLTMAPRREVDAADLVSAWKQANHDATAYYRAYGRDANPETLAKAKNFSADAKKIDDFITKSLKNMGRGDLVQALKDARVLIAKTYNAEKALNPATGSVSATSLGTQLVKGKPLSGELKQVADFGLSFPKAAQDPAKIGSVTGASPLDWFGAGTLAAIRQDPWALMTVGLRPAVRAATLSRPGQAVLTAPTYSTPLANMLSSPQFQRSLTSSGVSVPALFPDRATRP